MWQNRFLTAAWLWNQNWCNHHLKVTENASSVSWLNQRSTCAHSHTHARANKKMHAKRERQPTTDGMSARTAHSRNLRSIVNGGVEGKNWEKSRKKIRKRGKEGERERRLRGIGKEEEEIKTYSRTYNLMCIKLNMLQTGIYISAEPSRNWW